MFKFDSQQVQDSPFADALRRGLDTILRNEFFATLGSERLSLNGYRLFVREKYSSIGYFVDFLAAAEQRLRPFSAALADAIRANRADELGIFAGATRPACSHETWRVRSLAVLGVEIDQLAQARLASTANHHEQMLFLSGRENPFEQAGALLFLELFVSFEMKALIAAFERDLPSVFPKGAYQYDLFPFNLHEYWYSHALHDTWHFRCFEEPLMTLIAARCDEIASIEAIEIGIDQVVAAKSCLYSSNLLQAMQCA